MDARAAIPSVKYVCGAVRDVHAALRKMYTDESDNRCARIIAEGAFFTVASAGVYALTQLSQDPNTRFWGNAGVVPAALLIVGVHANEFRKTRRKFHNRIDALDKVTDCYFEAMSLPDAVWGKAIANNKESLVSLCEDVERSGNVRPVPFYVDPVHGAQAGP
jgi:hypothetical protein